MREVFLAIGLLAAAGLVTAGVTMFSVPVAFIVAGLLTAVLSVLFFAEVV